MELEYCNTSFISMMVYVVQSDRTIKDNHIMTIFSLSDLKLAQYHKISLKLYSVLSILFFFIFISL